MIDSHHISMKLLWLINCYLNFISPLLLLLLLLYAYKVFGCTVSYLHFIENLKFLKISPFINNSKNKCKKMQQL